MVAPGTLASAMLIAHQGSAGLASRSDPHTPGGVWKTKASKTVSLSTLRRRKAVSLFHAKSKTRIGCWNVRSLGSLSGQSDQLIACLRTMKEKRIDLLALSESRWPGQGVSRIRSTTILHSGSPSAHIHGVAIALSPQARSSWEAAGSVFIPTSERILSIRLKTHFGFATVVAVYAPTNPTNSTSEASAASVAFYDQLQSVVASAPRRDMVIVLGDFNARVGSGPGHRSPAIGPHCLDECNGNGMRLLDFCACNGLVVTNTWFQHKPLHQATWYRNGDRSRDGHLLDYVLISNRFRNSVLDTRVYRSTYLESDHELVISTLRFKIKAKRHRLSSTPRRLTRNPPDSVRESFKEILSAALYSNSTRCGVEESWVAFRDAMGRACEALPELPPRAEADWVTDELRSLTRKKRDAWLRLCGNTSDDSLRQEYQRLRKLTKAAAERARNNWWSEKAAEAERRTRATERAGQGGSLIKELRLLKSLTSKPSSSILLDKEGHPLASDDQKLARWAEHFGLVMNCGKEVSEISLESLPVIESQDRATPNTSDLEEQLCPSPTEEEISVALSLLKMGKAPGLDRIQAETLRLGGAVTVRWLKTLFDYIWSYEVVPADWRKQVIIPVHKKGSRADCDNYRGIALLSIPSKVFAKVILNRLKPWAEAHLRESQCGFRSGRSCADQLFTLRILMEKAREYHQPLYMCFIDLQKAYDSVSREALWRILRTSFNLPQKVLTIIQALHRDSMASVRAYGKTSEEFQISSGVRQGCILAPTLFNLYFDLVIRMALEEHQKEGRGVRMAYLHDGKLVGNKRRFCWETLVSDLEYADDMVLMANSWEDLRVMLNSLEARCSDLGLTISCRKTKLLAVLPSDSYPKPSPVSLRPGGDPLDVVSCFEYLGSIVSDDCSADGEIDSRVTKASQAFRSLSRLLWHHKKIKRRTKLRIFSSVIMPALLYGLETVALQEHHVSRLQSFVGRCLRVILGVSLWERKRSTSIRKMGGQQRVSASLMGRRLRFLGHLHRLPDHRLPRKLLVCAPVSGKRHPGGQKLRWNDLLLRDLRRCGMESDWRECASNRPEWRCSVKQSVRALNNLEEQEEKRRKDFRKRRREERQRQAESALHCDFLGCTFIAANKAGLVNHTRQKHTQAQFKLCQYCSCSVGVQGHHNHERYCRARPR